MQTRAKLIGRNKYKTRKHIVQDLQVKIVTKVGKYRESNINGDIMIQT